MANVWRSSWEGDDGRAGVDADQTVRETASTPAGSILPSLVRVVVWLWASRFAANCSMS